jgi:hypothetical protein
VQRHAAEPAFFLLRSWNNADTWKVEEYS